MARRRIARSGIPLEWIIETASSATPAATSIVAIDLDLLPDEVAQVHVIDSQIVFDYTGAVDGNSSAIIALSLDPSNVLGDILGSTELLSDLEVFYFQRDDMRMEITTSGQSLIPESFRKQVVFPESTPLIVGTNVGMNTRFEETNAGDVGTMLYTCTMYFKRRKATISELNQILLKRR